MRVVSNYLQGLIYSLEELKAAVIDYKSQYGANLLNMPDEKGKTLGHYAARIGLCLKSRDALPTLVYLFDNELDLSIQDNEGNTPLHVAAACCSERTTCRVIFPSFIQQAKKVGFDFNRLNDEGFAIIHLAVLVSYNGSYGRDNNVARLMTLMPEINVNVLSGAGVTPFLYAMNQGYFSETNSLLERGADPLIKGELVQDVVSVPRKGLRVKNLKKLHAPQNRTHASNADEFETPIPPSASQSLPVSQQKNMGSQRGL